MLSTKTQVQPEHYSNNYDNFPRFAHYFQQIDLVRKLSPNSVLEIGVGNGTVSRYLRNYIDHLETCDYDERLKPDHVADIRNLPFAENAYDLVMACEILEHLPWDDVEIALRNIQKATARHAIISIPYAKIYVEFLASCLGIESLTGKLFVNPCLFIPRLFSGKKFDGEHHWEMGRKNYPRRKVESMISRRFKILDSTRAPLNPQHIFYVLEKRRCTSR